MNRDAYDRFPSREPAQEWHPEAESQGREARLLGFQQDDPAANPYIRYGRDHWMYRSFIAGWCDADQDIAAPGRITVSTYPPATEEVERLQAKCRAQEKEIERLRDALSDLVNSIEETFDTRRGELKHLRRLNKARQLLLAGGTPETSTPESR